MRNLLCILLIAAACNSFAQNAPPPPPPPPAPCDTCKPPEEVLTFAEEMPHFPGGQNAFEVYLRNSIHYPDSAMKYGRDGTVYVYFEISKDGSIGNVQCKRGVPNAPELCEEAMRVIGEMPNWEPGKMNRKSVKVGMTVPIRFVLH